MKLIWGIWIRIPMFYRFIVIFGGISLFSLVTIVLQIVLINHFHLQNGLTTTSIVMTGLNILFSIAFFLLAPNTLFGPIKLFSKLANHLSDGNLQDDQMVNIACPDMNGLSTNLVMVVRNLRNLVTHIKDNANEINHSFVTLSKHAENSEQINTRITENAHQLLIQIQSQQQETESSKQALEKALVSIKEFKETTQQVRQTTQDAAHVAETGHQITNQIRYQMQTIQLSSGEMEEVIQSLHGHSNEIGQIVGMITDIAAQTNMLSLNASIEAARAGDQGRGFAVVASEVQTLAQRSADSAKQITDLIEKVQSNANHALASVEKERVEVQSGMEIAEEIGHAFQHIVDQITETVRQVNEFGAIAEHLINIVEQVAEASTKLSIITEHSAVDSQEIATDVKRQLEATKDTTESIQRVKSLSNGLQNAVNQFVL